LVGVGLIEGDVERACNFASGQNHDVLAGEEERSREPLSSITAPTLVIHGTADPMFPPGYDEALAEEISAARLLTLAGAGHGIDRADWETLARAILEHTGAAAAKR
jgi:pimeloyl-ACP methyl ester carboxylesterase